MMSEQPVSVGAVQGSDRGDGGVPHGELLLRFTEATVAAEPDELAEVSNEVVAELGADALTDAAGVISTFQMMNRIANATGTPLDEPIVEPSAASRDELGVDEFDSYHEPAGRHRSLGRADQGSVARITAHDDAECATERSVRA